MKIVENLPNQTTWTVLEADPTPTQRQQVAQQLLTEEINESRQSHMIELTATVEAIDLQVGDLVQVTNSTFGITTNSLELLKQLLNNKKLKLILKNMIQMLWFKHITITRMTTMTLE